MERTRNQWDATIDRLIIDEVALDEVELGCETVEDYIARFRSIAEHEPMQWQH